MFILLETDRTRAALVCKVVAMVCNVILDRITMVVMEAVKLQKTQDELAGPMMYHRKAIDIESKRFVLEVAVGSPTELTVVVSNRVIAVMTRGRHQLIAILVPVAALGNVPGVALANYLEVALALVLVVSCQAILAANQDQDPATISHTNALLAAHRPSVTVREHPPLRC